MSYYDHPVMETRQHPERNPRLSVPAHDYGPREIERLKGDDDTVSVTLTTQADSPRGATAGDWAVLSVRQRTILGKVGVVAVDGPDGRATIGVNVDVVQGGDGGL